MDRFFARLAINSAAIALALLAGCVALVFLVIAFYFGMTEMMQPWAAALTTAGASILLAILVLLVARGIASSVPARERERHRSAADLGEAVGRQAHMFLSANSPMLMLGLTVLGFALGFSPRLRKILMRML